MQMDFVPTRHLGTAWWIETKNVISHLEGHTVAMLSSVKWRKLFGSMVFPNNFHITLPSFPEAALQHATQAQPLEVYVPVCLHIHGLRNTVLCKGTWKTPLSPSWTLRKTVIVSRAFGRSWEGLRLWPEIEGKMSTQPGSWDPSPWEDTRRGPMTLTTGPVFRKQALGDLAWID